MRISRVVIKNFRSFDLIDVALSENTTCVIGENNSGKSNFLHAIRLCIDAGLASSFRSLMEKDVHATLTFATACQVLVGLEFVDFDGKENEEALVGAWQSKPGLARIFYRFRPKLGVREDLAAFEVEDGTLVADDYQWEIACGGDPSVDLADIEWSDDVGSSIRFSDLQAFQVVFLPALRDVENDLRQYRNSPLARLVDAMDIPQDKKDALVETLQKANDDIACDPTIDTIAKAVDTSFKKVSGPAFEMDVGIGMAEPSFHSIVRALRILLSNIAVKGFDPSSNGLGLNNILYVSILFEYFHRRIAQAKSAGQIILFEEPEAHLHPQLQLSLFRSLNALPFQSILTTHSTHITSNAPLASYVVLTQTGEPAISGCVPAVGDIDPTEVGDLERYLDATKSTLLYARKVMLVEGPAELLLIPQLVKKAMHIDLDREGISVIPIFGVHFDAYAKLFGKGMLPKKCAIVADGDLQPDDANPELEGEDELPEPLDLSKLNSDFVKVFQCQTTFERAITNESTLGMFAQAAQDLGAPIVAKRLRQAVKAIKGDELDDHEKKELVKKMRDPVLNTAIRFGKARFAQIAARHMEDDVTLPSYISKAVSWLREE